MLIKHPDDIAPSEITPQAVFESRREFLRMGAGLALTGLLARPAAARDAPAGEKLVDVRKSPYNVPEATTPYKDITTYGNYTEFSSNKFDQAETAQVLNVRPWAVQVDGLVARPRTFGIEDVLKLAAQEERTYRMRCVEGWSMVIPWIGLPLATVLKQVQPLGNAKYVEFTSLADPATMPNVRRRLLDFPYLEGLRLDEAMHPLALLAVGLYGEVLPKQNGAPIRLVVPWKYGFKGAKAIVRIRLVEHMPDTTWMRQARDEYGFFANVNPQVEHPRWSQTRERRIGEFFRRDTLLFNGYADQVASLYAGMDLRKNF